MLKTRGEEVNGQVRCGADGAGGLQELLGTSLKSNRLRYRQLIWHVRLRTGLPLSTYSSAIKLSWMIDNWEVVRLANKVDDLVLGTVKS